MLDSRRSPPVYPSPLKTLLSATTPTGSPAYHHPNSASSPVTTSSSSSSASSHSPPSFSHSHLHHNSANFVPCSPQSECSSEVASPSSMGMSPSATGSLTNTSANTNASSASSSGSNSRLSPNHHLHHSNRPQQHQQQFSQHPNPNYLLVHSPDGPNEVPKPPRPRTTSTIPTIPGFTAISSSTSPAASGAGGAVVGGYHTPLKSPAGAEQQQQQRPFSNRSPVALAVASPGNHPVPTSSASTTTTSTSTPNALSASSSSGLTLANARPSASAFSLALPPSLMVGRRTDSDDPQSLTLGSARGSATSSRRSSINTLSARAMPTSARSNPSPTPLCGGNPTTNMSGGYGTNAKSSTHHLSAGASPVGRTSPSLFPTSSSHSSPRPHDEVPLTSQSTVRPQAQKPHQRREHRSQSTTDISTVIPSHLTRFYRTAFSSRQSTQKPVPESSSPSPTAEHMGLESYSPPPTHHLHPATTASSSSNRRASLSPVMRTPLNPQALPRDEEVVTTLDYEEENPPRRRHSSSAALPSIVLVDCPSGISEGRGEGISGSPSIVLSAVRPAVPKVPSLPLAGSTEPNSSGDPEFDLDEENECQICMERPIDCVFVPCAHVMCCYQCGKGLTECPMCRHRVHQCTPLTQPLSSRAAKKDK